MREVAPFHWSLLALILPQYGIPALPLMLIFAGFAAIS